MATELGQYEVRKGKNGERGIFLRKYNIRLATFHENSEELADLLDVGGEVFTHQPEAAGLQVERHPKPDHAVLRASDLEFADGCPVLMTEKDAVKCAALAQPDMYYLEVSAIPEASAAAALAQRIENLVRRREETP